MPPLIRSGELKTYSYSEILQENAEGWRLQKSNKPPAQKRQKLQGSRHKNEIETKTLQGRKREEGVQLYLENLSRREGDRVEDIAKMVRQYASARNLRIMCGK